MSWNDYILTEFPEVAFKRISILFDSQSVVADEAIFAELDSRGYLVQEFTDTISLRYTYEKEIRENTQAKWIIIVRSEQISELNLPYDMILKARKVSFSLGTLFPTLSFSVIDSLDRKYVSALFDIRDELPFETLSEKQTCEFILERLFSISADIINQQNALLQTLFDIHFTSKIKSPVLLKYLADKISSKKQFNQWDIQKLFSSPENYATFLQERLISSLTGKKNASDWNVTGPDTIDFKKVSMKQCISHIFAAGYLQIGSDLDLLQKFASYLAGTGDLSFASSLNAVADEIDMECPTEQSTYHDWLNIAKKWSELTALSYMTDTMPATYSSLQSKLNTSFIAWQKNHYHLLASLPPNPPVMVHQIMQSAGRKISDSVIDKFALIVIDGMALNQWAAIRPALAKRFDITNSNCFAWIPTLTSISRQAIFSGKIPASFSASLNTTAKEENLWIQAWENYGVAKNEIIYKKKLGSGDVQDVLNEISPKTKICGLVIDIVDSIMHGMQLGNAGMHSQLQQWINTGYLEQLLESLIDLGFDIVITSDHGNIECSGIGRPHDGMLSEQHGERVRIYPDKNLISQVQIKCPQAFDIKPTGLPQNMCPVTLPYNLAFLPLGTDAVAHGGNSLEEVIVPLIHVTAKRGK